MRLRALTLLLLAIAAAPAPAQRIVTSPAPDKVAVTVYRDTGRSLDTFIDTDEDELGGYALVTERRTVDLPPGPVTIRFEGVASGIQPPTVIVTGLAPREKNQDRLLLSQRALLDSFTGQKVTVRRTNRATGKVREEPARIRSGPDGVILQTAAGFEALNCNGLNQTLVYPRVPPSLSPKPVLSIAVPDQPGGRRELVLSYLAGNFDWQANYVVDLDATASRADVFAWVTLASLDDTSFVDAQASVIGGRVSRVEEQERRYRDEEEEYWVEAECWPSGTTGEPPASARFGPDRLPELDRPTAERVEAYGYGGLGDEEASIVVTGSRIVRQEDLGDLKLYRVPFPVTVASRGQKQVAMLSKPKVKGEILFRNRIEEDGDWDGDPSMVFRFLNRKEDGLGESLPTGQVSIFQTQNGRRVLLGETSIPDKAVGEEVELKLEEQDSMTLDVEIDEEAHGEKWERQRLTVTNANPWPVVYEAEFLEDEDVRFDRFSARVRREPGKIVWRTSVPANGKATLVYRELDVSRPELDED